MQDLLGEFEGDKRVSQKELIGWNAADKEIVIGGMNSIGGLQLGTIQLDPQAKTLTDGNERRQRRGWGDDSGEAVFTKVDRDTMTFKGIESLAVSWRAPAPSTRSNASSLAKARRRPSDQPFRYLGKRQYARAEAVRRRNAGVISGCT